MGILNRGSCFTSAPSASRSKVLAHAGIVAVSVLTLAACGGATGTAPGATEPAAQAATPAAPTSTSSSTRGAASDPCSLINAQEASTALGSDAGTPSSVAGQCAYTTPTGNLTVIATQYPDSSTASSSYDSTRTAAMGGVPGFQDVSGIGDHAFLTSGGLVEFDKGSLVVIIQVLAGTNPTTSTMTMLGQAASGRV
jgi:hypothetical protein